MATDALLPTAAATPRRALQRLPRNVPPPLVVLHSTRLPAWLRGSRRLRRRLPRNGGETNLEQAQTDLTSHVNLDDLLTGADQHYLNDVIEEAFTAARIVPPQVI